MTEPHRPDRDRPTRGRVVRRMVWQGTLPAVVATGYASWMFLSDPKSSILTFFNTFGVAFFLVMWFVGQYIRTSKQLEDSHYLETLTAKVDHIATTVRDRDDGFDESAPDDPVSATLLTEARTAMAAGHLYSGLVKAGVAFEHALQQAAERAGIPERDRDPMRQLVDALSGQVGSDLVDELHELRVAHQALEHLNEDRPPTPETAKRLFEGFRWAIGVLERIDGKG